MWIDRDYQAVGDVGFLVEVYLESANATKWRLRDTPPRTNQSLEPRIAGWCGSTNGCSVQARGMARVTATNVAGDRMRIERLSGAELATALEDAGYPELTPDE